MRVFAIADPHLSREQPKPMDIFGPGWLGHPEAFFQGWRKTIKNGDLVLIPGDISWAMRLDEAMSDLEDVAALPGKKVLLRGNHDYWWPSIAKLRKFLPAGMYAIQNDALRFGELVIAGTRGWVCPGSSEFTEQDNKVYLRELQRLKLSLAAARALGGEKLIVMLHYPPTNLRLEPSGFTEMLLEAKPDALVFGHLHGDDGSRVIRELDGIAVHFVAADALGFEPRLILDLPD